MPCPKHAGKHAFHDTRWIATHDAEVSYGHDPRDWGLENGSLICEMRDGPSANAHLIAAAPDLLAALERIFNQAENGLNPGGNIYLQLNIIKELSKEAIAKAKAAE